MKRPQATDGSLTRAGQLGTASSCAVRVRGVTIIKGVGLFAGLLTVNGLEPVQQDQASFFLLLSLSLFLSFSLSFSLSYHVWVWDYVVAFF